MQARTSFPILGIYRVIGGISDDNYLTEEDQLRYQYITPAEGTRPEMFVADCWIVDKNGEINPGTSNSPVPFRREVIGNRVV